jgi:hypothetical protein
MANRRIGRMLRFTMRRAQLVLLAVFSLLSSRGSAADVTASAPFPMKYLEVSDRQDGSGVERAKVEATVTLHLSPDGHARLEDEGLHRDSDLVTGRDQETTQKWRLVWQGLATQQGDALSLRFTLADSSCSRAVSDRKDVKDGHGDSTSSSSSTSSTTSTSTTSSSSSSSGSSSGQCGAAAKNIQLACRSTRVRLDADRGQQSEDVWQCNAVGPTPGGTPAAWVFGKRACVEMIGGRAPRYRHCAR